MDSNNHMVYRHVRLDTNEPFYIGIGKGKRPWSKYQRSDWWRRIVKNSEYRVDILWENVDRDFAVKKEMEFIELYGRKDKEKGTLCNMTDGGDGGYGTSWTEERRKNHVEFMKKFRHSEESKEKMSRNNKGRSPHIKTRLAVSKAKSGVPISESHKKALHEGRAKVGYTENQRRSQRKKGEFNHTKESKEKMSKSHKGKILTDETKRKISDFWRRNGTWNAKTVLDTNTGIFYNSIQDASNFTGLGYSVIADRLKGRVPDDGRFIKV